MVLARSFLKSSRAFSDRRFSVSLSRPSFSAWSISHLSFRTFLLLYVLFAEQKENGCYCSITGEYVVGNEVFIEDADLRKSLSRCEGRSVNLVAGNNNFDFTLGNGSFLFDWSEQIGERWFAGAIPTIEQILLLKIQQVLKFRRTHGEIRWFLILLIRSMTIHCSPVFYFVSSTHHLPQPCKQLVDVSIPVICHKQYIHVFKRFSGIIPFQFRERSPWKDEAVQDYIWFIEAFLRSDIFNPLVELNFFAGWTFMEHSVRFNECMLLKSYN